MQYYVWFTPDLTPYCSPLNHLFSLTLIGCTPMQPDNIFIRTTGASNGTLIAICAAVGLFLFGVAYYYCRTKNDNSEMEAHLLDKKAKLIPPAEKDRFPERDQDEAFVYMPEFEVTAHDIPDFQSDLSSLASDSQTFDSELTSEIYGEVAADGEIANSEVELSPVRLPDRARLPDPEGEMPFDQNLEAAAAANLGVPMFHYGASARKQKLEIEKGTVPATVHTTSSQRVKPSLPAALTAGESSGLAASKPIDHSGSLQATDCTHPSSAANSPAAIPLLAPLVISRDKAETRTSDKKGGNEANIYNPTPMGESSATVAKPEAAAKSDVAYASKNPPVVSPSEGSDKQTETEKAPFSLTTAATASLSNQEENETEPEVPVSNKSFSTDAPSGDELAAPVSNTSLATDAPSGDELAAPVSNTSLGTDASDSISPWIGDIDLCDKDPSFDCDDKPPAAETQETAAIIEPDEPNKESEESSVPDEPTAEPANVWLVPLDDLDDESVTEENKDAPATVTPNSAAAPGDLLQDAADLSVVWLAPSSSPAELAPEKNDDSSSVSSWSPDDSPGPWLAPV